MMVGAGSMMLPTPYEKLGFALFLVLFLILIVLGHKVAFRNNKYGVFAQYTHPIKLMTEKLNKNEKVLVNISIITILSIMFTLLIRVNLWAY
jgi:hypothetical protein